jgi:hypothetical protein
VPLSAAAGLLFLTGFVFMRLVFPAGEAPLAEVSPAPLGKAFPVPPGAIVSAFAAPEDVDAFGVPCASVDEDANAARQNIKEGIVRFNLIKFSLVKRGICTWMRLRCRRSQRLFKFTATKTKLFNCPLPAVAAIPYAQMPSTLRKAS